MHGSDTEPRRDSADVPDGAPAGGPPPRSRHRKLRALAGTVLSMLIAAAGVIGLLAFFAARDVAPVTTDAGPGHAYADQGSRHLRPGQPHPRYDSDPPTSGAHVPVPVRRDARVLSDDQILHALEAGNVILVYGSAAPPPQLARIAARLDARFTPALAALGQAVILARRPGTRGIDALAWRHLLHVDAPQDPRLAQFADLWLGRPAR